MRQNSPTTAPIQNDADRDRYVTILVKTFHSQRELSDAYVRMVGQENLRGVRIGDELVGGLALLPKGQFFGGKSVPMTGIAAVAIEPAARARGAASGLMRDTLIELRRAGVPLSALYPATQPVYRRAGYEVAGTQLEASLPLRQIDVRDHSLEIRPATEADQAALEATYLKWATPQTGNLDRKPFNWERVRKFRGEPMDGLIVGDGDRIDGYIYYTERAGSPFPHSVYVQDIVATTPAAGRRLLSFLADHRSMSEVATFTTGPSDPLLTLLAEQIARLTARIAWMLRLVHLPNALAARGYPAGLHGELHLDVRDDVLADNAGRCMLTVSDGVGRVEAGGRGTFQIDVRGLAALYSGYLSPAQLEVAGYLHSSADEKNVAAGMFAGPSPWMRDSF